MDAIGSDPASPPLELCPDTIELASEFIRTARASGLSAPTVLMRYIAAKGSICVDGVSLTVNAVEDSQFEVNLVPHTVAHTAFAATVIGDPINLEVDVIARYLERLLIAGDPHRPRWES